MRRWFRSFLFLLSRDGRAYTRKLAVQALAVADLGFQPSFKKRCPWEGGPAGRLRGSVYHRGNECVCLYCFHVWQESPPGPLTVEPRLVEEVGNALFPPPNGFRMTESQQIVENV